MTRLMVEGGTNGTAGKTIYWWVISFRTDDAGAGCKGSREER